SPRADTVGQRLAVLRRLAHPSPDDPAAGKVSVVVAPVRAVLQPQVPRLGELVPVELHPGDTGRELGGIVADLVAAGYVRSELLLTDEVQARAAKLLGEHPELAELLDPISRGDAVEGMEALAPVLVDELSLVVHELPAGAHVLLCDPERVRTRAADLVRTSVE